MAFYVTTGSLVTYDILEGPAGKHGVIYIPTFMNRGGLYKKIKVALEAFKKADIKGVVIDLRGNDGGEDEEPPELAGFFTQEKSALEHIAVTLATHKAIERANMKEAPLVLDFMLTELIGMPSWP